MIEDNAPTTKAIMVPCPSCKTKTLWSADNSNRPFCSERCRNQDFIGWSNGEKVMQGNSVYADVLSGDLGAEHG